MVCHHRVSSPCECWTVVRSKSLEVTRASLTTCYASLCDSAQRLCARLPRARAPRARTPLRPAQRPAQPYAQMGSSPFQCLPHFFFIFFSSHRKIPKKNIYLFSFIFQYTNKFIKIYFIYFFYFFFHFPTNQINCLNLFYLFSCSSLHIVNSKVCFPICLCAIYLSTQTFTSYIHDHTTFHQITQNIPNTCMQCPSFVP